MFDVTVALVTELGPAAVTIEGVAARSGVARSTIYRRWPDVNRLFVDAFKALTALAPTPLTGRLDEDLATFGHQYARELDDPVFFSVVVFLLDEWRRFEALPLAGPLDHEAAPAARRHDRAGGHREGELSPEVDPIAVADAIMAPLFHQRVGRHQLASTLDVVAVVSWALAVARGA